MNLNTHIMLALAVGAVAFHRVDLAVLVAIGAAIPDLDREYVFTKRRVFERYQLHRALLHNVFFAGALSLFNQYLGLGVFLHILLDLLTSPTDRGVEVLFPLGRFVRSFKLDLDGRVNRGRSRITWYMEDPVRLVRRTSDPELREEGKAPWIRVYGPFKNSRLADWTLFYSSLLFLVIYEHIHGGFLPWFLDFLRVFLLNFLPIEVGVISFYAAGEWWRRSLQFRQGGERTHSGCHGSWTDPCDLPGVSTLHASAGEVGGSGVDSPPSLSPRLLRGLPPREAQARGSDNLTGAPGVWRGLRSEESHSA
jgi:hypothetical protein